MAQLEQQMPIPLPDLSTIRITTAVTMLGKAYGCGQCSGEHLEFIIYPTCIIIIHFNFNFLNLILIFF